MATSTDAANQEVDIRCGAKNGLRSSESIRYSQKDEEISHTDPIVKRKFYFYTMLNIVYCQV